MAKRQAGVKVNPAVLRWARESAGWGIEDIARKLRTDSAMMRAWESGKSQPSLKDLERLAGYFKRPLAALLLPSPPSEPPLPIDFRLLPKSAQTLSRETRLAVRRARRLRRIAVSLLSDLDGDTHPRLRPTQLSDSPDRVAQRERDWLGVDLKRQLSAKSPHEMFEVWRAALEARNILVFRFPMPIEDARGFSVVEKTLPVIVVNATDAIHARIFTLFHEFGHLLLNEPGICNPGNSSTSRSHRSRVEAWCNKFAGSLLLPSDLLESDQVIQAFQSGDKSLADTAAKLSGRYKVSTQVVLRRLHTAGLVDDETYQRESQAQVTRPVPPKSTQKKIVIRPERRCLQEQGRKYVGVILESRDRQVIPLGAVADYLSLSLKHIDRLEALMGG